MKKKNTINMKDLEERIWQDIAQARRSFAVYELFVMKLLEYGKSHFKNKDYPLISAIMRAALDSVIMALGRLLKPKAKEYECTLSKYRTTVINALKISRLKRNISTNSENNFKQLMNRKVLKKIKKLRKNIKRKLCRGDTEGLPITTET